MEPRCLRVKFHADAVASKADAKITSKPTAAIKGYVLRSTVKPFHGGRGQGQIVKLFEARDLCLGSQVRKSRI